MIFNYIPFVADILGILGFVLTIVLLVYSEALRKQISVQKTDYVKEQKAIRSSLIGHRDSIWMDNLMSLQIRSEIRTSLLTYKQKYKYILSIRDKYRINITINMLSKGNSRVDIEKLCSSLDYLIARFARKEK